MGVTQTNQSFQNDGNFSQLDLLNVQFGGPIMRLETFRCSHPEGEHGITAAGTPVTSLAGNDHLSEASNRTFRMIFSYGQMDNIIALLEMREYYEESGSASLYIRDIDGRSSSFGVVLSTSLVPRDDGVTLRYKILQPSTLDKRVLNSPYYEAPTKQVKGLADLAEVETLHSTSEELSIDLILGEENSKALADLSSFSESILKQYPDWATNVQVYQRMGDFRDKCLHHATNLIGQNPRLASEFIIARNYRLALIIGGYTFDPQMRVGAATLNPSEPLSLDTKPGVYSVFLSAYALNVGLYQLGIDKVHSD